MGSSLAKSTRTNGIYQEESNGVKREKTELVEKNNKDEQAADPAGPWSRLP
jgi:hypothetical protein